MGERKVLNKYYAPDFDRRFDRPRRRKTEEEKIFDKQFHVRIMAPCNMRCNTCGEYIAKAKKFNSRQETVKGETYLGLRVYRFYIRCPRCMAEISFKTDLENEDYVLEHGASRNFQAQQFAEKQAEEEVKRRELEVAENPMLALEKRTQDSLNEMARLEALEELRDISKIQSTFDHTELLKMNASVAVNEAEKAEEEDEAFVRSVFGRTSDGKVVKRIPPPVRNSDAPPGKTGENDDSDDADDDDDDDDKADFQSKYRKLFLNKPTEKNSLQSTATLTRRNDNDANSFSNKRSSDSVSGPSTLSDNLSSKVKRLKAVVKVAKPSPAATIVTKDASSRKVDEEGQQNPTKPSVAGGLVAYAGSDDSD